MVKTRREKFIETNVKKHGSLEAWKAWCAEKGRQADRTTPRGFAVMDKDKVLKAGEKGRTTRWGKSR